MVAAKFRRLISPVLVAGDNFLVSGSGIPLPAMRANLSPVTCGVWPGVRRAGLPRLSPPLTPGVEGSSGGHGDGSIYRDKANGTWAVPFSLGWTPDGQRIRRKVTGRTRIGVRNKLRRIQAEAEAGLETLASYTLAKAVEDWAAEATDGLADKTVRTHVDLIGRAGRVTALR